MGITVYLRDNQPAEAACRKLRKLLDRSGQMRELRQRERFEKPSAVKHRASQRAVKRTQMRNSGVR